MSVVLNDQDPALNVNAYHLISNNFGPYQPKDIQFPRVNGRSFRQDWYVLHEWLEYSPINDAAFCFYCRCFPPSNKYNELAYTLHGFKTWARATKSFKDHENSASHKEASVKVSGFHSSKNVGSIATNVSTYYKQTVQKNREYLTVVLDSLLFCCRQGYG